MAKSNGAMKTVCILLALLLVMACTLLNGQVYAENPREKLDRINNEIKAKEAEIAKSEKDKKQAEVTKQLYTSKADLERQALEALAQQIDEQNTALEIKQAEIAQKILDIQVTKDTFEKRMVAIYINKDRSGLDTLLSVEDFSQLLRVSENLKAIAKHDTDMMQKLRAQQAELEEMSAQIQVELDSLNAKKAESERLKAEYENSMLKAQLAIDAAAAAKASNEAAKRMLEPEREQARREWEAWIAQDIKGGEFIGGVFAWPLAGHYNISSGYGERADNHRGIDITAPTGTPIFAAADGTVSTKADSSYGICVKLSHGGGVVSVYGHMSARAQGISDGVAVAKGDRLGYVGSTGVSTGPHLHFEIDVGGRPINPYTYLQG